MEPSDLPTDAASIAICGTNKACLYDLMTTQDESFAQETISLVLEHEQIETDTQPGTYIIIIVLLRYH